MRSIMRAGESPHSKQQSDDAHRRGGIRFRAPQDEAGLYVSDIRFSPAGTRDAATGLLGWVSFTVNDSLRLDGIAVRRTRAGELRLSFPAPTNRDGRRREVVRPVDASARERIEAAVLEAITSELD
jgi:DNA-binding cell septation regulator SpoVG